jgi:hypothetical protein
MKLADVLPTVLDRLAAAAGEVAQFSERELAEWPAAALARLKAEGLLAKGPPADTVVCPGCEEGCTMPVETDTTTSGTLRAFVVCDQRDDVARVGRPRKLPHSTPPALPARAKPRFASWSSGSKLRASLWHRGAIMSTTDFPPDPPETDKTGETVTVGNDEFLRTLFAGLSGDVAPVVTSFKGNPATVTQGAWKSRRWQDGTTALPAEVNNYFSLSTFRPDDAGEYRRRKAQFVALHVVMLDDIGGKVPMERVTLPPTWLLETSPGNHQAGYLLTEPITDGLLADRLMNAIVAAELCDPGANGPRARLARLPVAVNGKHAPPFVCRINSRQGISDHGISHQTVMGTCRCTRSQHL